eukprot:TRINITY_DN102502_c0_g1_i1.p1 TRINITY_DN102502_c0_g1~~TRINITY_DN102502_c0_g1_i1.p1  ORF type:complete len:328 (-),score=60.86 TRINITY_DN102502_c0_g1_i1:412-1332(-)
MHEAADEAVRRQLEGVMQDQASELQQLRRTVESMAGEKQALAAELRGHAQEIAQLRNGQTDCHLAHEACAREREELRRQHQSLEQEMREELRGLRAQLQGLQSEFEKLRSEHRECKMGRDDLLRQIERLREEMPRIASRAAQQAAREALERMPRPASPPRVPTPPPVVCAPDVSEDAFAVLRGPDNEKYELVNMENTVGRSSACEVCIPGSQAVSNKHLVIAFTSDGTANVKDLNSRNGTFLNEHRVAGPGLVLKPGDHVQLGVDGPSCVFEWGPKHYARWPREHLRPGQRASSSGGRLPRGSARQ